MPPLEPSTHMHWCDNLMTSIPMIPFLRIAISLTLLYNVSARVDANSYPWQAATVQGNEIGVLVLCPGMNQDGSFFLQESPWVEFATQHQLGILSISFKSDPAKMYGQNRQGYYWPEQGSGEVLIDAIRTTYGTELPILIYGYSGGAQFASRFVEWIPQRVTAWAAYSAQFWDAPRDNSQAPPGIVACGDLDGSRWHPSFSYFYRGRTLTKNWAWVSIRNTGHVRNRPFEEFVRSFFATVQTQPPQQVYIDVETEEIVSLSQSIHQELLAVLPSHRLVNQWRAVHAQ